MRPEIKIKQAAELAVELSVILNEMAYLIEQNDRDQLHAGLHMMSVYEKLMISIEGEMHPSYRKNIEEFRKKNLTIGDQE